MAIDVNELLLRICAIEVEALNALPTPIPSNAVPRRFWQQERLRYWRNWVSSVRLDIGVGDDGQEVDTYVYAVDANLIFAHVSEGYNGEVDEDILRIIPQVIQYFDEREVLQSNSFPEGMAFLRYAYFQSGQGYAYLGKSAAGGDLVGPTFQFICVFDKPIAQAY